MTSNDFTRSNHDHCVYFRHVQNRPSMYLLLYVDDMLLACEDKAEIQHLKVKLNEHFEMKDLGSAKKIIGIAILEIWVLMTFFKRYKILFVTFFTTSHMPLSQRIFMTF